MKDLFSIKGKVALVTGGSRGIGEMIAAGFLASGAKVYISSRKAEVCDATAERLTNEYGGECISLPSDLSNLEGIEGKEHTNNLSIVCWGVLVDEWIISVIHVEVCRGFLRL